MFTAPRQHNNEAKTTDRGAECLGISGGFILNEEQWLNFPSLAHCKTDTRSPLDFLLCAAADESGAGITQLQHSRLQIQG